MPKTKINAKNIKRIHTYSSMYDEGKYVVLTGNGKTYRMDVNEFLKLLNDKVVFKAEKKTIHTYLTIDIPTEEKTKWMVVYNYKNEGGIPVNGSMEVETDNENDFDKAKKQARKELREEGARSIKITEIFLVEPRSKN